ncbi:MAG TPA: A24 family peptidase [Solirubrobacteraceae bacterium]|nr:A24 family peptidase [Solirubrobacteraceae bacterium]
MKYVLTAAGGLIVGALLNLVIERLPGRESGTPAPSWRRPAVTVSTAVLAVLIVLVRHRTHDLILGLVLLVVLMPIVFIDLEHRLIPNKITAPAAVAAIVIGLATRPSGFGAQVIAGVAAFAFLFLFALIYPKGLGMGDVKLAGVMGLYLAASVVVALFSGLLAAAVLGVGVLARRGVSAGRRTYIPLGPFLALGGLVGILVGPQVVHWYVHSVVK